MGALFWPLLRGPGLLLSVPSLHADWEVVKISSASEPGDTEASRANPCRKSAHLWTTARNNSFLFRPVYFGVSIKASWPDCNKHKDTTLSV